MQSLSLISTCLSIFAAVLAIWVANNSGIRRLVIIQKRLDSCRGLIVSLQSRIADLEKFNKMKNGYHIRGASAEIEKFFKDSYDEHDTGF